MKPWQFTTILILSVGVTFLTVSLVTPRQFREAESSELLKESVSEPPKVINENQQEIEIIFENSTPDIDDRYLEFINLFYKQLEIRNYEWVYDRGTKKYSLETLAALYDTVDKIEILEIRDKGDLNYELDIALLEFGQVDYYRTQLKLSEDLRTNDIVIIESSSEKVEGFE